MAEANKTFKILQLINLLHHRRSVTVKTIKEVCGVSDRTAYRYLNAISETNIPVYFDKAERAYRLSRPDVLHIDDLSLGEAVIATFALKLLSRCVNEEYRDDVEKLLTKLLAHVPFAVEEVLPALDHILESGIAYDNHSERLSSLLIQAAILCNRKVRLTTRDSFRDDKDVEIDNPSLLFKKSWQLVGGEPREGVVAPLAEIDKVTIV
ncbi:MAG TPA: HTH domain-containing protein [Acidobacteriota bacterium]|nr:HTH domain-containing protein [Acidobacteriota bacterium]